MEADRTSALFWALFAAGGFVVALLLPLHLLVFHFGPALGLTGGDLLDRGTVTAWLANPLAKLYLLVLMGGALFHAAHRFKHVLFDWGMTRSYRAVGYLLYAVAVLGTLAAVFVGFLAG